VRFSAASLGIGEHRDRGGGDAEYCGNSGEGRDAPDDVLLAHFDTSPVGG
jgi:hypothetical protein